MLWRIVATLPTLCFIYDSISMPILYSTVSETQYKIMLRPS